jgi:hypothetical protein
VRAAYAILTLLLCACGQRDVIQLRAGVPSHAHGGPQLNGISLRLTPQVALGAEGFPIAVTIEMSAPFESPQVKFDGYTFRIEDERTRAILQRYPETFENSLRRWVAGGPRCGRGLPPASYADIRLDMLYPLTAPGVYRVEALGALRVNCSRRDATIQSNPITLFVI